MSSLYRLLDTYEPVIYIGLTIWGLFIARGMYQTWLEWRDSAYSLEREFALQKLIRRTVYGLFILGFIFAEFFISTFIVPTLPASDILSTPTLNLLATSSNTLSSADSTQAALLPATQSAPSGMSGCVPESIMITAPGPGEEVQGTVVLNGTASIPNFGFYKYEISSIGSNVWATVSAGALPVINDKLGEWDTSTLANGDYFLQLVLIDNVGKTVGPCVIALRVMNP